MEPTQISETINKMQLVEKPLHLREVLERYQHIDLTEEEMDEAILWRKQKKEKELEQAEIKKRTEHNRSLLTGSRWSLEQTVSFMQYRSENMFEGKFKLDTSNIPVFNLLTAYFSEDKSFLSLAQMMGIEDASFNKGIFLCGSFGTGKTWMMKLFQKNQRQCFIIRNAKEISDAYESNGDDVLQEYLTPPKNAVNDSSVFYQPILGLCIDDLGTEQVKMNYGNKKNVIGDIIEKRYANNHTGAIFHGTTNLTPKAILDFYGGRVADRMNEIFNIIELKGQSRRK